MSKKHKSMQKVVNGNSSQRYQTNYQLSGRDASFWKTLEHYNNLDSKDRVNGLKSLGMNVKDDDIIRVLTKSHFVIPGVSRFECINCGECCRYAKKIATFTYESCAFLNEKNMCSKHDSRYLVCKWFPFWVYQDEKFGPFLTIKPYCGGYGHGDLIDYEKTMDRMSELTLQTAKEDDGAFVIHELLHLPGSKEWAFPSKENVDKLLRLLSKTEVKASADIPSDTELIGELHYAHHYTSGLLGNILDPQLTVNETGIITDVNEAFCNLCGKERDDIVENKLSSLFVNSEGAANDIQTCFYRGKITAIPHRIKMGNETTVPVLFNAMTFRARNDGLVHGSLICIKEITNIIYNELAQSKNYVRGLIEASLDCFMVINIDGTLMDVNQAFVKLTGFSRERLIGDYFNRYFLNPEEAQKGIYITFKDGLVNNYELDLKTANNEMVPVSFNASVFNNHEGIVQGIFAVARDIRENRRIMKQLEDSINYARGLIESSVDLMVTVNCEGIITDVNEAAVELTGSSREKLINSRFQDYFTEPLKAYKGINIAFNEGKVKGYELELINLKSEKIPVSFNANVYKNSEETVMGVFAIARDMRKSKAA